VLRLLHRTSVVRNGGGNRVERDRGVNNLAPAVATERISVLPLVPT
jgi:hypothetical protein